MEKNASPCWRFRACVMVGAVRECLVSLVSLVSLSRNRRPFHVALRRLATSERPRAKDRPRSRIQGSGPTWKRRMRHRQQPMNWARAVVCDDTTDHLLSQAGSYRRAKTEGGCFKQQAEEGVSYGGRGGRLRGQRGHVSIEYRFP
jgi:hypothetical protein